MSPVAVIIALDMVLMSSATAMGALYIRDIHAERTETMKRKHTEPIPAARKLLDEAAADYRSPQAQRIRGNLGWQPKPAAQFDADGILRDGNSES